MNTFILVLCGFNLGFFTACLVLGMTKGSDT